MWPSLIGPCFALTSQRTSVISDTHLPIECTAQGGFCPFGVESGLVVVWETWTVVIILDLDTGNVLDSDSGKGLDLDTGDVFGLEFW